MSGRVVKTVMVHDSPGVSQPEILKWTSAPSLRPIQLRCIVLSDSGQSSQVEVIQQPVGIGGDPQHPLAQRAALDRVVAALGTRALVGVNDFLVGQHGAELGQYQTGACET